ncbi:hypothetical protein A3D00_00370 [Candidatus Woesebacteria bacterium RIFCSPHIGHO2_02_FULL_38_9]|uniref:DUF86 domain-containing protein n=1 Tax=Candidatus Woesebacteria bacterium RIFCSPHIGHO2_01_FULL_39_28 TaxID=1802496 RepID=A0A1F7YK26_9BACT|nr:MAG: hypothetical protein A2627_04625 [Candidatus Woesebacteria bacterium RIFCSPHIGHO2_01_FULL_39_28]OGM33187.1 MAG: hypothetical protein A3D00_00370 [Candidatus Woesebacteria bacterium RIFCSPHIGHO2_02_FULL_38_9]OGM57075.1 MAG: hypothetical protein A3A50_05430 [Candidatus Woesebacteria bacterium RIFCSPLOWO2_01_FULL_38_20]
MIDKEMVKNKISEIQKDLSQLAEFKNYSFDGIVSDYRAHKAVERIIEVVINEAININQHLIIKGGYGELPFDFKESFLLLTKLGVYSEEFAKEIANSVGLRNILVHQYRKLDEKIFFESMKDCLSQYTRYCGFILKYLEKN